VVRYYSIVTEPAGTASAAAVSRLSREVNRVNTRVAEVEQVKSQVEEVKTAAATDRETYTKEIADLKNQVSAIEGLKKEIAALKSESSKKDLTIKKLQKDIAASRRTG
jgi:DNA repair exonuclease SbcCD ATPase subunit